MTLTFSDLQNFTSTVPKLPWSLRYQPSVASTARSRVLKPDTSVILNISYFILYDLYDLLTFLQLSPIFWPF